MSVDEEKPLRSSSNDFDRFQTGTIWFDMQQVIKERIDVLTHQLIQTTDVNELFSLKGEIKAWKEMSTFPAYLKQCKIMEQEQNDARRKQTDESAE